MFVLDTNVVSEMRKAGSGRANPHVVRWLVQADATSFYVSAVTLQELEFGVLLAERRDPPQGRHLRAWIDNQVQPEFVERTLAIDRAVALRCARLHVPDPRPEREAFIAATALVRGMTVVTCNVDDFLPTGVAVVNPWEPQ